MTYPEAQRKAWTYIVLGYMLLALSFLTVGTAFVKGIYYGCSLNERFCASIKAPVNWIYGNIFFVPWLWKWLPDAPFNMWYLSLLSSAGLCALFFFLFALFLSRSGIRLKTLLNEARWEADKRALGENYRPGNTQTTGPINAGGNVKIEQILNNNPEIRNWNKSFSKSSIGLIVIATVGGVLTLYLGQLIGLTR